MKQILLMRHAKAVDEAKSDFVRELSQRGKDDIKLICDALLERKIRIKAVFSSKAVRCEQSAKKICDRLGIKKLKLVEEFYEADANGILKFLREIDNKTSSVLIIAHNPAISELAEFLGNAVIGSIPTCGIFGLEFDGKFSTLDEGGCKTLFFEYPKKHRKNRD